MADLKYNVNVDFATQIILRDEEGNPKLVMTFPTEEAAAEYRKFLRKVRKDKLRKEREANQDLPTTPEPELEDNVKEQETEPLLDPQQMEALRKLGWLRDDPEEAEPDPEAKAEKPRLKDVPSSLKPRGSKSALVRTDKEKGEAVWMPSVVHAIYANLLLDTGKVEGKEVAREMERLRSLDDSGMWEELDAVLVGFSDAQVVDAIRESYLGMLMPEEHKQLRDKLIGTGNAILQCQFQDEETLMSAIKLGVLKNAETWEGDNLIGHVLMSLRAEFGGTQDPRIDLVRGEREYTIDEMTPPEELDASGLAAIAEKQAELLLGKRPESKKRGPLYDKSMEELKGFIVSKKFWPFPVFDECVLWSEPSLSPAGNTPQPMKDWLAFCHQVAGVQFSGGKRHEVLGGKYLQGVTQIKLSKSVTMEVTEYDVLRDSHKIHINLSAGGEWWTWYMSEVCAKLSAQDLVVLFEILGRYQNGASGVDLHCEGTKAVLSSGGEKYEWNFRYRSVKARQSRKAFATIIINGKNVSSNFVLLWLALVGVKEGIRSINGLLSSLTNLWEREANYGHSWESSHPTRRIRDNSGAPLTGSKGFSIMNLQIGNGKFSYELFQELVATPAYRHDCYTDKVGMKLMAGGGAGAAALTSLRYPKVILKAFDALDAGVNPLLVLPLVLDKGQMFVALSQLLSGTSASLILLRQFGEFVTANDGAKVAKFLNRAQQGGSWPEALTVITFNGEVYSRTKSMMTVVESSRDYWVPATTQDEEDLLKSLFN